MAYAFNLSSVEADPCDLETSLVYILSSRTPALQGDPISKNKTKQKSNNDNDEK